MIKAMLKKPRNILKKVRELVSKESIPSLSMTEDEVIKPCEERERNSGKRNLLLVLDSI